MQKRAVAIIIKDRKVLLMHRIKNGKEYFVFPGGGVEEGESLEQAVVREIKEELGLDVKIEKELFVIENQGRQEVYFLVKSFTGKPKLGGEEKERMSKNNQYFPVWLKIDEAINLLNLYPEQAKDKLKNL